jgi:hypothetical protein
MKKIEFAVVSLAVIAMVASVFAYSRRSERSERMPQFCPCVCVDAVGSE